MVFGWALVMIGIMLVTDKLFFEGVSRRIMRWQ
jgi:hypothetical protein